MRASIRAVMKTHLINRRKDNWAGLLLVLACMNLLSLNCRADFVMDLTRIGNAGNRADDTGCGAVNYAYSIGTYEVTVAQYTEFLNAVAKTDPYELYNPSMGSGPLGPFILQSGTAGSFTYTVATGCGNQPVRYVSFFDGLRLCNWLSNGQGSGDTETGSYDMSLGYWVVREASATWALSTEDEWYKAAYYDPVNDVYYDYPNGSDAEPVEPTDTTTPREMNFGDVPYWQTNVYFADVGETTGVSPYGTYDQGGNVQEWMETRSIIYPAHLIRGGTFTESAYYMHSGTVQGTNPDTEGIMGFRVVYLGAIPEPSSVMLMIGGGVAMMSYWRRKPQSRRRSR